MQRVDGLVVVDEEASEGSVGGRAAGLGAVHVDPLRGDPLEDVSGHLGRLGVPDRERHALPEEVGAQPDVVEPVPQHADVVQAAHRPVHVPVVREVGELHAPGVRVGEDVVAHHHPVDGVPGAHGLETDPHVDVLEGAVGHREIGAAAQQAHAAGLHVDALVRDPVGRGGEVPVDVGEAEGEPADVHVAHARALDHVDALRHLDPCGVRVLVAGKAEVQPAALALPVEPELAGAVEVLGLVFQVEAAAADDLVRRPAAPPPGEGQRAVLAVDGHDPARVRAAHHPAHGGPHDGVLVVLLRLALVDVVLVERQVPLPAVDRRDVVERLVGVLPGPPLALDVVRVGDRPVRRAGQGDARHGAVLPDRPDAARGPGEVDVPDLLRLGDQAVRGAPRPARHGLRAGEDGRPLAPGRVAGQEDGGVRGARLMGVQLAPVVDALLEHIGVRPLAGRCLAAGAGVPGVVLPGTLLREAVVGVVAALEVDIADRLRPAGTRRARAPIPGRRSAAPSPAASARTSGPRPGRSPRRALRPAGSGSRGSVPSGSVCSRSSHLVRRKIPSADILSAPCVRCHAVSGTGATEVPLPGPDPRLFRRTGGMPGCRSGRQPGRPSTRTTNTGTRPQCPQQDRPHAAIPRPLCRRLAPRAIGSFSPCLRM